MHSICFIPESIIVKITFFVCFWATHETSFFPPTSFLCYLPVHHHNPSPRCFGPFGGVESGACLHFRRPTVCPYLRNLEVPTESLKSVLHGVYIKYPNSWATPLYHVDQSSDCSVFQVPFIPALPLLSVLINVFLMVQLGGETWLRYAIWMLVGKSFFRGAYSRYGRVTVNTGLCKNTPPPSAGLVIYFCYGIRNSVQRKRLMGQKMNIETVCGKTDVKPSFKTEVINEERF